MESVQDYRGEERRSECAQGASIQSQVHALEKYQGIQNGHLGTIRKQLWALVILMLGTLLSAVGGLTVILIMR